MPTVHHDTADLPAPLRRLYRTTSVVWTAYAVALALTTHGSVLLRAAEPGRFVLTALASIVALAMVVRAIAPGRPEWTRWTLPLMCGTSVAAFTLLLFAADSAGGFTSGRAGFSLLVLTPGVIAYVHYLGEKAVTGR